jgi:hypothetical protein
MRREPGWLTAGTTRAVGAVLLAMAASAAWAGNTIVYRCLDSHLGVVYTDLPCKDGEAFETREGDADASAVARLEHLRDMLDQSAAQRLSDERRLAGQKELASSQSSRESDQASYDNEGMLGYLPYGYAPVIFPPVRRHPHHHHAMRPSAALGAAPKPPFIVPRP